MENNRELSNDCNESENVTNIKKTSLVFKLCHDHSDSHKISNVAEFLSELNSRGTNPSLEGETKLTSHSVFTSFMKRRPARGNFTS